MYEPAAPAEECRTGILLNLSPTLGLEVQPDKGLEMQINVGHLAAFHGV